MGLCGFGFGGYKEKIDPKIVLVSLFQGRLFIKKQKLKKLKKTMKENLQSSKQLFLKIKCLHADIKAKIGPFIL